MALIDDLKTTRDNIGALLAEITASPKPSYSVGGQSVSWSEYFSTLTQQLTEINKAIQQLQPFWNISRGKA